jgi:hypothetical protein
MNNDEQQIQQAQRRVFLWECSPSSETRGRRKEHSNGCNWWNISSTVKNFPIQTSGCEKCRNRPRKDKGAVWIQPNLNDAIREQEYRNQGWGEK